MRAVSTISSWLSAFGTSAKDVNGEGTTRSSSEASSITGRQGPLPTRRLARSARNSVWPG